MQPFFNGRKGSYHPNFSTLKYNDIIANPLLTTPALLLPCEIHGVH
jgi:hypothetical protein